MGRPVHLAGLTPVDHQTLSLSDSTALALNGTIQADASYLWLSVETQDARMRADGTDPTLNTGVLLSTANSPYIFEGYNGTANLKFQRSTGTCTINVMAFSQPRARD